jgi:hypothetical protein
MQGKPSFFRERNRARARFRKKLGYGYGLGHVHESVIGRKGITFLL